MLSTHPRCAQRWLVGGGDPRGVGLRARRDLLRRQVAASQRNADLERDNADMREYIERLLSESWEVVSAYDVTDPLAEKVLA